MFTTSKNKLAQCALAIALGAGALTATPVHAGNTCKKVYLQVANQTGQLINIVDLDYWDPSFGRNGGWRSEPVRNEQIANGRVWQETRNLERVNQRQTRIRVEYRVRGKHGGWSLKKTKVESGTKLCSDRTNFMVTLR